MNARDVPEDSARGMRCPQCAARRGVPCRESGISSVGRIKPKKRACMARRRAWLERNNTEETS